MPPRVVSSHDVKVDETTMHNRASQIKPPQQPPVKEMNDKLEQEVDIPQLIINRQKII